MLTPDQLIALRAAVFATPPAAALLTAGNSYGLRDYLNGASTFIVWRTAVTQDEIMQNGFDWTRVDNLSLGKARIWEWLFDNQATTINPSKPNVRAGIDQCWVGTAADLAVRAAVYVHCKRAATQAEKMLATGTGTDASPGLRTFEGEISDLDSAMLIFKDNGTIWTPEG
jgi:hypothetical protein